LGWRSASGRRYAVHADEPFTDEHASDAHTLFDVIDRHALEFQFIAAADVASEDEGARLPDQRARLDDATSDDGHHPRVGSSGGASNCAPVALPVKHAAQLHPGHCAYRTRRNQCQRKNDTRTTEAILKNILVLVHDDAGQEARIQVALDMVRALEGHLTCLDVAIPAAVVGEMEGVPAVLALDETAVESQNRARLEPRIRMEQVPYDWIDAQGYLGPMVKKAAGLADVIVLNRDLDGRAFPDMYGLAGEALIDTGRPIVAVPGDVRGIDLSGHVLVAWDGSVEADAALRAAVPLLRFAGRVTLIEIDDGSLGVAVADAAAYLSRHDVHVIVRQERATFDLPSTIILDAIDELKVSYLVMGGFGHSRFIEAALGGVTRRILHECPVPAFLAR